VKSWSLDGQRERERDGVEGERERREKEVNALSSHESNKSPKLVSVDSQPADKTAGGLQQGNEMLWNCRAKSGRARGRGYAL